MTAPIESQEYRRKSDMENAVHIAEIARDVGYVRGKVESIERLVQDKYVTIDQFSPVRNIVYGMVGLILIAVIGALITLVIRK